MIINDEKWACETCIKGHRATHCKHTDRELIQIKKKGRPTTQCNRCRELRIIRQLHVKCDCENQESVLSLKKRKESSTTTTTKKIKSEALRPLAPKKESCCDSNRSIPNIPNSTTQSIKSPSCCDSNGPVPQLSPVIPSCCDNKNKPASPSPSPLLSTPQPLTQPLVQPVKQQSSPLSLTLSLPEYIPKSIPPSSCCGPPSKNQQGETIRIVTCRCGDSCACIGCDAHPSRAMKEAGNDVYIGYNKSRRLSMTTAIDSHSAYSLDESHTNKKPSSVLSQDGTTTLCGCGCGKNYSNCSGCFQELCSDYYKFI